MSENAGRNIRKRGKYAENGKIEEENEIESEE